jgi:pimeloyl-ACP methyl ester carboxylesterase
LRNLFPIFKYRDLGMSMQIFRVILSTQYKAPALVVFAMFLFCAPANAVQLDNSEQTRVTIHAGDVELGATLYRPIGAVGDLPAIVTAHGSAASTRDGVGFYTDRALRMGFAVLSFDKRGTGISTGEYVRFTVSNSSEIFRDLASDVAWSTRWLAQQDGIDRSRIGLFGGSQAGWIMPLSVTLLDRLNDPEIAFIIAGEGVPVSAGEEAVHERAIDQMLVSAGQTHTQTAPTPAMMAQADLILASYDGQRGFDPFEVLVTIDTPTLWIFGLRDGVIPVMPSIARLGEHIAAGKTNNDIHVFPFGDHNFTNVITGGRYDVQEVSQAWLTEIGILSAP